MGLLDIYRQVEKELGQGMSRLEVLEKHSSGSPSDTPKIAFMLASIPHSALRQKYLKLNGILFLLLLCLPVFTVMSEWPIDFRQPTLFIALKSLIPLILAYFVFYFYGGVYRLIGLWCLIDLLESLLLLNFTTAAGLAKTVLLFLLVVISFILARKVFPHLKILGPRQDSDGRYML